MNRKITPEAVADLLGVSVEDVKVVHLGPPKKETVAEFLARGGQITKVAPAAPTQKSETIRSTNTGGPANIVTMDHADLYHGEAKKSKAKKKAIAPTIDITALPEELRKKYIDGVISAKEAEDEEDE